VAARLPGSIPGRDEPEISWPLAAQLSAFFPAFLASAQRRLIAAAIFLRVADDIALRATFLAEAAALGADLPSAHEPAVRV
jgi:hypothetical protein